MLAMSRPTFCVIVPEGDLPEWDTGAGAGVDSAWEHRKLEARKMLDAKRAAESPASSARCDWAAFTLLFLNVFERSLLLYSKYAALLFDLIQPFHDPHLG